MLLNKTVWLPVLCAAFLAGAFSGCAGEKEAGTSLQLLANYASKDNQRKVGQISLWKQEGIYYYYRIGVALPGAKAPVYCEVEAEMLNDARHSNVSVWAWAKGRGAPCAGMGGKYLIDFKSKDVTRLTDTEKRS